LSIENARYIFNNMKSISEEITFKKGGIMEERVRVVLNKSIELLQEIEKQGLFNTIEKGIFANIKRPIKGGKGLDGVIKREKNYYNPFMEIMAKQLKRGGD
jgi:beta-lysine 5,6-aminomutase alpha subunit